MTTALMFIFSQWSPFNFSGKFDFKILLKLSQKLLHLFHAKFIVFVNDLNTQGYRLCTLHRQSYVHKEWFSKKFSEGYRTLTNVIINLHLYLKSHYSIDALHCLLQKWNVTSTKYEKHWTLTIIFNPNWEQKIK